LDEPLGALDLKLRKQMQLELKRIQTEVGITFVYVTHDQDEAMTMSDRIAVMRSGRIEQLGDPVTLYERPATEFVAGFLGVSNLLEGRVAAVRGDVTEVALKDGAVVKVPTNGLADGSAVRLGVRPEKLRVAARGDGDGDAPQNVNRLDGTIVDASYVGVSTQYIVRVAEATDVAVYAQNIEVSGRHEQLASGSAVRLTWKPEHTFVIKQGAVDA
jgi:spermidine/putrescine transport system ATP-binding protein